MGEVPLQGSGLSAHLTGFEALSEMNRHLTDRGAGGQVDLDEKRASKIPAYLLQDRTIVAAYKGYSKLRTRATP